MDKYVIEHQFGISRKDREQKLGHRSGVLWFVGLSGSGKSTIANLVEQRMFDKECRTVTLDGDSARKGLCKDLGFSQEDRSENLRRIAEVAKLFATNGSLVLACFITPLNEQRELIKEILGEDLHLIYVKTSLKECESRDPKGLYRKARTGEIKSFTGISSKFDEPTRPELIIDTEKMSEVEATDEVIAYAKRNFGLE